VDQVTDFYDSIVCPHCGDSDEERCEYPSELQHDGDEAEIVCNECDRTFFVALSVSYAYGSTTLADKAEHCAIQEQHAAGGCYGSARDLGPGARLWQAMACAHAAKARKWHARLREDARKDRFMEPQAPSAASVRQEREPWNE
jgi:hypothetical protein